MSANLAKFFVGLKTFTKPKTNLLLIFPDADQAKACAVYVRDMLKGIHFTVNFREYGGSFTLSYLDKGANAKTQFAFVPIQDTNAIQMLLHSAHRLINMGPTELMTNIVEAVPIQYKGYIANATRHSNFIFEKGSDVIKEVKGLVVPKPKLEKASVSLLDEEDED